MLSSRILLLSPHPGRVRAEFNSNGKDEIEPLTGRKLSDTIHDLLFSDQPKTEGAEHD
jgi:hypothetical protein